MPIIQPTFKIPDWIPLIGGEWGPFLNMNLGKSEQKQLFILFVVSIVLIAIFGSLAYATSTNSSSEDDTNDESKKGVYSFFIGLFAGIIFGLIDNAGLWFGMDSLDPIFDGSKVPWVYGYGGKRQFSGINDNDECVYYGVEFKDGKLMHNERINGLTPQEICEKTASEYTKVIHMIDRSNLSSKEKARKFENILTNEKAFADPNSQLFMGSNMRKEDFFKAFSDYRVNENMYHAQIEVYRKYLNNQFASSPEEAKKIGSLTKKQFQKKLELKDKLKRYKGWKSKYMGNPTPEDTKKAKEIEEELKQYQVWPGKNKKLAKATMNGYKFGSLSQAALGNTFSDVLGSFLSSFILIMLIHLTNVDNFSILTETLGIFIGCLLGILLPRTLLYKLTYKT